ncbi:MAG: translocation/assembly module TamB, partial [Bacteroidales bacterium]|nr:translocation/assembly module TamB [Bacteroidales bacterium]
FRIGRGRAVFGGVNFADDWSAIRAPSVVMTFKNILSFRRFASEVGMNLDVGSSSLSLRTVGSILGRDLGGAVIGIGSFKAEGLLQDLHIAGLEATETSGGLGGEVCGSIRGLPVMDSVRFDLRFKGLGGSTRGLKDLLKGYADDIIFRFDGKASGSPEEFAVRGALNSTAGAVKGALTICDVLKEDVQTRISGTLSTEDLDCGKLTGLGALGAVSLNVGASARLGGGLKPAVTLDSLTASRVSFLGYDYGGIAAAGSLDADSFDGKLICSDPNLHLLFQGVFNLSNVSRNALYKFYANIGYADLKALGLDTRGGTSKISARTYANFVRVERGDLIGNIGINSLMLENGRGIHDIGSIDIDSHTKDGLYRIKFASDFLDAAYVGSEPPPSLITDLLASTAGKSAPALLKGARGKSPAGSYEVSASFHDSRDILDFLMPGLYIADSTAAHLTLSKDGLLDASLSSPRLAYWEKNMTAFSLNADNGGDSLRVEIGGDALALPGATFSRPLLRAYASNGRFAAAAGYSGSGGDANDPGILGFSGSVWRDSSDSLAVSVRALPSSFVLDGRRWRVQSGEAVLGGGALHGLDIEAGSGSQKLKITGGISRYGRERLDLRLEDMGLGIVNLFTHTDLGIGGKVSGYAIIKSPVRDEAVIQASLKCDSLSIGGYHAGMLRLVANTDEGSNISRFHLRNTTGGHDAFKLKGSYNPFDRSVDATAELDSLDLRTAAPLLAEIFSETSGTVSGSMAATGPLDDLEVKAERMRAEDAAIKIRLTGARYIMNGPFDLDAEGLHFRDMEFTDGLSGKGVLNASILHDGFRDFSIDGSATFSNMTVIDLPAGSESLHGRAAGDGIASIKGPLKSLSLESEVTVKSGAVSLPVGSGARKVSGDILTFRRREGTYVDPYLSMVERRDLVQKEVKGDLDCRLRINATPGFTVGLEMDRATDNVITIYGNGSMSISSRVPDRTFDIHGDYDIHGGKYRFSALSNMAVKDFNIESGSRLKFNGAIPETEFDVKAVYRLNTSLSNLIADTTSVATGRLVNCSLHLSDRMKNPRISFSIDVPDLEPTTKAMVQSALNTEDKVQTQFLALLLTGTFIPAEQGGVFNTSNMLYSNLSSIMSGQLNNILKKLEIPVDLGLNYLHNNVGSDVFKVAVSTRLFNNRVTVGGSIGNRKYTGGSGADVVGDLDVEVKLNRSGSLRMNVFSHSADVYSTYLDKSQRNGIGIMLQQEFSNIRDFFRRIFSSRKKREQMAIEDIQKNKKVKTIDLE